MANDSVEALLRLESRLNRSFAVCAVLYVATIVMSRILSLGEPPLWMALGALCVVLSLLAGYIWFAVEVTLTAKAVAKNPAPYLVWMIAAPFLILLGLPIVSTLVAASPLSLKFLLAGQLRTEIHDRTFSEP